MTGERIAKFLSAAGVCSRREAERLIAEGRVKLNGAVLDTPATLVTDKDSIVVDGKKIQAARAESVRLFIYHKPAGLVTSHKDEKGRATVFETLPAGLPRVISVGRLDLDSEGLLLLTTSGALSRALELPKNAQKRTYKVRIRGTPMQTHLDKLRRGVTVDGVQYQPIAVTTEAEKSGRNQWLTLTLKEGKNREIRRIFDYFDLPVSRLIRTAYGAFELGPLRPGEVKEVPAKTVQQLLQQFGVDS